MNFTTHNLPLSFDNAITPQALLHILKSELEKLSEKVNNYTNDYENYTNNAIKKLNDEIVNKINKDIEDVNNLLKEYKNNSYAYTQDSCEALQEFLTNKINTSINELHTIFDSDLLNLDNNIKLLIDDKYNEIIKIITESSFTIYSPFNGSKKSIKDCIKESKNYINKLNNITFSKFQNLLKNYGYKWSWIKEKNFNWNELVESIPTIFKKKTNYNYSTLFLNWSQYFNGFLSDIFKDIFNLINSLDNNYYNLDAKITSLTNKHNNFESQLSNFFRSYYNEIDKLNKLHRKCVINVKNNEFNIIHNTLDVTVDNLNSVISIPANASDTLLQMQINNTQNNTITVDNNTRDLIANNDYFLNYVIHANVDKEIRFNDVEYLTNDTLIIISIL